MSNKVMGIATGKDGSISVDIEVRQKDFGITKEDSVQEAMFAYVDNLSSICGSAVMASVEFISDRFVAKKREEMNELSVKESILDLIIIGVTEFCEDQMEQKQEK